MEVSTFELLVKPSDCQSETSVTQSFRQIIQGYCLTVSNLEAVDITFQLEVFVSSDAVEVSPQDLELLVEIGGSRQKISLLTGKIFGQNRCLGLFRVPAGQTALVQLVPRTIPEPLVPQNWEVRGYTVLRVPQLPFCSSPQSKAPVKVQLKPETRRILQNELGIGDQAFEVRCPLAIASDRALNELEAEAECFSASASLCGDRETTMSYLLRKIENFELSDSDLQALAGDDQDKILQMVELASDLDFSDDEQMGDLLAELNVESLV